VAHFFNTFVCKADLANSLPTFCHFYGRAFEPQQQTFFPRFVDTFRKTTSTLNRSSKASADVLHVS